MILKLNFLFIYVILLCITESTIYILFLLQKKKDNFAIESSRLREHGHVVLVINPDLLQGCEMQKLNGNTTGESETERSQTPFEKFKKDEKGIQIQN